MKKNQNLFPKWFLTVLILHLHLYICDSVWAQSREQDSLALVALYDSTNGPNWRVNTNWRSTNPINTWYGITLNAQGLVSSIHLYDDSLKGTLPPTFGVGNLTDLVDLLLYNNRLKGNIPNFNSPQLQTLRLYQNELTGSLPNFNLPQLQSLDLWKNQFDSIPDFNQMPNLQYLWVNENHLKGNLPAFANLTQLVSIRLSDNQFTGSIPSFNLPFLQVCWLYLNQFDSLPSLSHLSSLNNLSVAANRFTFDDILPNLSVAGFAYNPQDSIFKDTAYSKIIGQSLTINLGIDGALTTNVYKWYKNGSLFQTTSVNQLTFNSLSLADAGLYTCDVTNSGAPALTLRSHKITLQFCGIRDTTVSSVLCGNRAYRLPSNRIVYGTGTYIDTVATACDSLRYTVTLINDTTGRCQDSLALVELYDSTNGPSWRVNTNWRSDSAMNTWYGIQLDAQGRVQQINLHGDSLRGTLPASLNNLKNLRLLNLSGNRLTGSIPNFNLPNLKELDFTSNQLSNSIPNFNLPNLQNLSLSWNQLSGNIPNFNLPNLIALVASHNLLSTIPNFNLPNLKDIYLDYNQLSGSIPNFNLPNLSRFFLNSNQLSNSIPNFQLPNLVTLHLYENQLSGSIPNFNLPRLETLLLFSNQLSGSIPNFNGLPNLNYLELFSNQLSGSIPNFNLPNLRHLYLNNNQLSGSIPATLSNLSRLSVLGLGNNQLSGTIPYSFSNFVSSPNVDCFFNANKIDSLPDWSDLTNLTYVNWFSVDTCKLTFDDILPNIRRTFTYTKQDSIYRDTTFSKPTGQSFVINLGIDGALTTNVYKWYKNGTLYQTTNVNQLTFNSLVLSDAGLYTCEVTNPGAPLLTLYSRKITVQVGCAPTRDTAFTASLCIGQRYRLPSGRTVNTLGNHIDTLKSISNTTCDSLRFAITLINDTGGRCGDSLALVELYDSTNGANWRVNTNWRSANPINTWYGITLDAQWRVQYIRLSGDSLRGTLPPTFGVGNLLNLQSLVLYGNQLSGSIPNFNSPNLESLWLTSNQLSGSIPNFNLPNLTEIDLSYNQLSGIPNFNLPKLRYLWLTSNQLSGSIPNFNLTGLRVLDLGKNQLNGIIPNFNWLPNLIALTLDHNQVSGTLPTFNLQHLYRLSIDSTLIDSIPNLSALAILTTFKADTNRLTFDDILPNIRTGFTYWKQDSIYRDTTFSKLTGQSLNINLGIDGALTTNVYKWYKNGTLYQTTSVNQLIFNSLSLADAGLYTCEVTNPGAPLLTLYSRKITLQVGCKPARDTAYTVPLCTGRTYTSPSGRTINAIGNYQDTIRSVLSPSCDSLRYALTVANDNGCGCQDSLQLVALYRATGGTTWTNTHFWLSTSSINNWYGITQDASGCVQQIDLNNNLLNGTLPNITLSALQILNLSDNRIDSFATQSSSSLTAFYGAGNRVTFDDILPNLPRNLRYAPQDSFYKDTAFTRNAGSALTIALGIDGGISNNVYEWYKNGVLWQTLSRNQLIFNILKASDQAIYTCRVTNPNAPSLTLMSRKITITVTCSALQTLAQASICQGYFHTLPSGRITTVGGTFRDTIPSWLGCDSVIHTTVTFLPTETTRLPIEYDCTLTESKIETTLFMNRNGCDSNVIRTRIAARNAIELPLKYLCEPNDTATQIRRLTNQYGCDSIVTQRFASAKGYNKTVTKWVCSPAEIGVRTTRDTTFLGCDSIVTTRSVLARKDSFNFLIIECRIQDTGTIRKALTNRFGCDSIVIERHRLVKKDTLVQSNIVCDTLFERMDTTLLKNRHNCDSLVIQHYVFDNCTCLKENNIYNGLIPNDADNQNDYFNISFIERYQPNELIISDKRGSMVYRTQNYRNTWAGTHQNGDPLPEGIYDYVFRTRHPVTQKECLRMGTLTITYIP